MEIVLDFNGVKLETRSYQTAAEDDSPKKVSMKLPGYFTSIDYNKNGAIHPPIIIQLS